MKNNENQAKKKVKRSTNWIFILYPDSTIVDWKDYLESLHVSCAISPLHDKDINGDGSKKKPHHHILLSFDSLKSLEQVQEITNHLNATIPLQCHSVKGSVRYFAHLDNPEKVQYDIKDIQVLSGFDLIEALRPSSADRYTMISEMIDFIQQHQICEFDEILTYARKCKFDTWFPLLCDNSAYIISNFIKSKRNRLKDTRNVLIGNNIVNVDSGEVVDILDFMEDKKDEDEVI